MVELRAGMLVRNVGALGWGPGKIVHIVGDKVHIVFRDLEEEMAKQFQVDSPALCVAEVQSDPILDNLPPLLEKAGRWTLPRKRLTLESLKQKFLNKFPAGFSDPLYFSDERDYKLAAHVKFQKLLGIEQIKGLLAIGNRRELATKASQVLGAVNIISPYESAAFHDAMKDDDAVGRFFWALLHVLESEPISRESVEALFEVVGSLPAEKGRVASWPVATALLYLADPERFMFMKPDVTKEAAASLGFDLKYDVKLGWTTYEALQRMGQVYLDLLRPLGARDFVDVQSFIYVTCDVPSKKSGVKARKASAAGDKKTTSPGYKNENGQIVVGCTGLAGTDYGQIVYEVRCEHCGEHYGANGSDIWLRKCPKCQGGQPGFPLDGTE